MSTSLAEQIEETQLDLSFDYSKINPKYYANANPNKEIIIYKGALKGYESEGLLSRALGRGYTDHILEVKDIIENRDEELIYELFDRHTSYYHYTALLSATFNPEQAQVFAPTRASSRKKANKTIYQLKIRADRCVLDYYDTGNCGSNKELFILGAIFPEEISAVKINNDGNHSELISPCGHYIRWQSDTNSTNRNVKDISNWKCLGRENSQI